MLLLGKQQTETLGNLSFNECRASSCKASKLLEDLIIVSRSAIRRVWEEDDAPLRLNKDEGYEKTADGEKRRN
jgi:hypothetical protein